MKLLDTTFLIHYWAGRESVKEYLSEHEDSEFITTVWNIKEIAVGRCLHDELDRHEILSTFDWVTVVSFSTDHAFEAGRLEANLHADESVNQDKINSLSGDLLIGAVAEAEGATVVTENTNDFRELGVPVDSY